MNKALCPLEENFVFGPRADRFQRTVGPEARTLWRPLGNETKTALNAQNNDKDIDSSFFLFFGTMTKKERPDILFSELPKNSLKSSSTTSFKQSTIFKNYCTTLSVKDIKKIESLCKIQNLVAPHTPQEGQSLYKTRSDKK